MLISECLRVGLISNSFSVVGELGEGFGLISTKSYFGLQMILLPSPLPFKRQGCISLTQYEFVNKFMVFWICKPCYCCYIDIIWKIISCGLIEGLVKLGVDYWDSSGQTYFLHINLHMGDFIWKSPICWKPQVYMIWEFENLMSLCWNW